MIRTHRLSRFGRAAAAGRGAVLVADRDHAVGEMVRATLTTEGYDVAVVSEVRVEAIRRVVEVWEPDCLFLEGPTPTGDEACWDVAAWIGASGRAVPVVMVTHDPTMTAEIEAGTSQRSRAIAAVLQKPIDVRSMSALVRRVVRPASRTTRRGH